MSGDTLGYIAALDIGTTTIRCVIINSFTQTIGSAYSNVQLLYPKPGHVEINPDEIWTSVISVVKNAVADAKIRVQDVKSLGISTQRATFTTWKKTDGVCLHNFITWKDLRAQSLVNDLNSYWKVLILRWVTYFGYVFTRSGRCLAASKLKFACNHVTGRLLWALQNIPELKQAVLENNAMFGTLETWLLYKLTGGKTYVTDISNASATGLYDAFILDWGLMVNLFNIPAKMLPPVVNNDHNFGNTMPEIFGSAIRIGCVMSDQSASLFGSCCFTENDLKVTVGTGGFLNINTCADIHPGFKGMYFLVGWKLKNDFVYISEAPCNDAGSLIEWALNADLIKNPSETCAIANSVGDNDGVYFIAAFSGLGIPINNEKAASGFMGIKPTTKQAHMVRAILESIVFRIALCFFMLKEERNRNYRFVSIDGGVSKNDFVCQMLADVTGLNVERQASSEMSSLGVGFLAGLSCGFWKDKEQLQSFKEVERVFKPTGSKSYKEKCSFELHQWVKAAERFKSWYM